MDVVEDVSTMSYNSKANEIARDFGLNINTVAWEDCARSKNSCWGPCISDMTLNVKGKLMPLIRYPNYEDLTWDVPMEKISLLVGNERSGQNLTAVTLKEYLSSITNYLSSSPSGQGSLLASSDSHAIVSAQACFLPVPKSGEAKFNVSIFNYQSSSSNPAVLAIVASSKGTSAQIVESGSQLLYYNQAGERCSFIGQRLSDVRIEKARNDNTSVDLNAPMSAQEQEDNVLMIIQVPLKVPISRHSSSVSTFKYAFVRSPESTRVRSSSCDVENAQVKIGKSEGIFKELGQRSIERDTRYPVRVTLQFYKCTSNGVVNRNVMKEISDQIEASKKNADFIGSLVTWGKTNRPTETKPSDYHMKTNINNTDTLNSGNNGGAFSWE